MSICFQRLLATLVLVAAAWTDDARAEELSSAEKEASAMLESYTASFASKSAEEMVPFFHIPMLVVFDTGVVAMNRNLDIVRYVQSIQSKLTEMDYAYSNWTKLRIKELNSGLVVASTSAIRYNGDGGIIAETGSTYVLRKAEDGWKIATFISHAPDRVLPLD
ncbi:MAG: nuclear transport factor 2 family protein [Alphaproteobacteria bacterium]